MKNVTVKETRIKGGFIQVIEEILELNDDGSVKSFQPNHSRVITPIDDTSSESSEVRAVCAAVHTPEVIAAYQASQPQGMPE